jgi:hypothetical protein
MTWPIATWYDHVLSGLHWYNKCIKINRWSTLLNTKHIQKFATHPAT